MAAIDPAPVLSPGPAGAFDESGTTMSCVVEHGGHVHLYYTGWSLGVTVPFYFFVGHAVSEDGGATFQRVSAAPLLERDRYDPYLTASPYVLVENGRWRMWYVSGTGWEGAGTELRHHYLIKYAESADGWEWERDGRVCVPFKSADEHALSRPCVVRDEDGYRMWYSTRGERYALGYAESPDGLVWTRRDEHAGLDPAPDGWDSEMIAYPLVLNRRDEEWLLYNGNGYGRSGIGWASRACAE